MPHFDGTLNFDTSIDTTNVKKGLKTISELAKQGASSLSKLTLKGLETSAKTTITSLSKLGSIGFSEVTNSLATATADMTGLGLATTKVVSSALDVGKSFDSAMSQIIATAGITKDTMVEVNGQTVNAYDTLSNKAKELGASTQFSASEVAEAFNYMAIAGWDVEKQLGSIDGVLDLAAASGLDWRNG